MFVESQKAKNYVSFMKIDPEDKKIVLWLTNLTWIMFLLCYFKDPEQSKSPKSWQPKTSGSFMKVDPEDFKDGASDDDGVEPVEGGGEEGARAQGIHSNVHLKDKGTKEQEFCVN